MESEGQGMVKDGGREKERAHSLQRGRELKALRGLLRGKGTEMGRSIERYGCVFGNQKGSAYDSSGGPGLPDPNKIL